MEDEYQILQARYQSLERRYAELLVEHTKTKRQLRESIKRQDDAIDKINSAIYG
jgi:hypothetical protein